MASSCLQKKQPRSPKSVPGGAKIKPWGGQHGVSEASSAAVGRQVAAKTALEAVLGSWRLLGQFWRLFGQFWPCQEPQEALGAPGEGLRKAFFQRFVERLLVRLLALSFALFLLAWHAPGQAANIEVHERTLFLQVAGHSRVFHAHRKGQESQGSDGSEIDRNMPRKPKAREAKKIVPKGQICVFQKGPKIDPGGVFWTRAPRSDFLLISSSINQNSGIGR